MSQMTFVDISLAEESHLLLPTGWTRHLGPDGSFIYFSATAPSAQHHEHPLIKKARFATVDTPVPFGW